MTDVFVEIIDAKDGHQNLNFSCGNKGIVIGATRAFHELNSMEDLESSIRYVEKRLRMSDDELPPEVDIRAAHQHLKETLSKLERYKEARKQVREAL